MNVTDSYITKEQIDAISKIIINQSDELAEMEKENRKNHPELYDEDFMRGRKPYDNTGCILSGFRETIKIPEMTVKKIRYGKNRMQPELESDTAIVQIYSSGAKFTTNEIRQKSQKAISENKAFFVFQFYLNSKAMLNRIDLVRLDRNANEISRDIVYERAIKTIRYSA